MFNANLTFTDRQAPLCFTNPNYGLVTITPPAVFGAMLVADLNNDG